MALTRLFAATLALVAGTITARALAAALAVAAAALAGCSADRIAAPAAPVAAEARPSASLVGSALSPLLPVKGLLRSTALPDTLRASVRIGGGVARRLTIPEAGLTLDVPGGVLADTVTITVKALPGRVVAYEMLPHGLVFRQAMTATQALRGTNAGLLSPLSIRAAYFKDASQLDQQANVHLVDELLGTTVDLLMTKATFRIVHFSGYMVSSGFLSSDL